MAGKIEQACIKNWSAHKSNCSGFVKAVAAELSTKIALTGDANGIDKQIGGDLWVSLGVDAGAAAAERAGLGYFVVGSLAVSAGNGHVVVVVPGTLALSKYPRAYWGTLNGTGKQNETINWSWNKTDRDKVHYAYYKNETFL